MEGKADGKKCTAQVNKAGEINNTPKMLLLLIKTTQSDH